ncbi:hypothetical protein [Prosthecobacter sp.]
MKRQNFSRRKQPASLFQDETNPITPMKTIVIILLTLVASQFLYVEYGPFNPVARVATAAAGSMRWFLHSALNVME